MRDMHNRKVGAEKSERGSVNRARGGLGRSGLNLCKENKKRKGGGEDNGIPL